MLLVISKFLCGLNHLPVVSFLHNGTSILIVINGISEPFKKLTALMDGKAPCPA